MNTHNGIELIDHPVIAVTDLDQARAAYERLGFTVPPRGSHIEWGTGNHCIMFADDYLEMRGIIDASRFTMHLDTHLERFGAGLMHVVVIPHLTPELIRCPEFLDHANGCLGVNSMAGTIQDIESCTGKMHRLLGQGAVETSELGVFLRLPSAQRIALSLAEESTRLTEMTLRVASVEDTAQFLASNDVEFTWLDTGDIQWEYGWSGYRALTSNHLPKIFSVGDNYWAGIDCNGRGIAMTTAMGATMAALVSGQSPDECAIPIVSPRRIMGFGLRRPGVAASVVFNRLLDVAERHLSSGSSRA